ncbi:FAD-dependent oxidoreductase [Desulfallas sp. Bu1-1]|uniref:FAD-dependent oxidoreductase n=1 Tax=Desulfallas sp. Bu1-1 TaxID=2787620 RepID=UPI0037BF3CEA
MSERNPSSRSRSGSSNTTSGRQTSKILTGDLPAVAPSAIPSPVSKVMPHELSIEEIDEIIEAFVSAARRAASVGVDLVEVHGGHGYLGSQFLSPNTNKRTDKYGGGQRGRARFLIEVIKGIKNELGRDFLVSCRINGSDFMDGGMDFMDGGMTFVDAQEAAQALLESGVDVLNVSAGVYGSYPSIVPPSVEPQGCFVELAENIKKVVPVPVITVGRIKTPELAEKILAEKKTDFVALGRALIADPDWVQKTFAGKEADIRPCIGCNQGCIDSINAGREEGLTCTINPWAGREFKLAFKKVENKDKVVVVGGGPAGLNAAWVMAKRGYQVTLVEEQEKLGGQLRLAAIPPGKAEFREAIDYFINKVQTAGVETILGKRADVSLHIPTKTGDTITKRTPSLFWYLWLFTNFSFRKGVPLFLQVYGEKSCLFSSVCGFLSRLLAGSKINIA